MSKTQLDASKVWTAISGAAAEWLFAVLPLVVVTIVMSHVGRAGVITESAEWAFGASILAGQALVRFVGGVIGTNRLSQPRVLLVVSLVLVGVVVPANITLALVIMAHEGAPHQEGGTHISSLLATAQMGLFLLASVLFILLGSVAHLWAEKQPGHRHTS